MIFEEAFFIDYAFITIELMSFEDNIKRKHLQLNVGSLRKR
ncbi:hypothetical protein F3D3_0031 [Fusibacter sp. 3D3]|nr:hypothetical protein F3D3_0031 [Fusibacter sp. 3D3]